MTVFKRQFTARAVLASIGIFSGVLTAGDAAFASGFEKTVLWSGRYSGIAGIANSNVEGSQSLAFNPAGLLTSRIGQDASLNLSGIASRFKGPVGVSNQQETGEQTLVTPFSLIYSATLND